MIRRIYNYQRIGGSAEKAENTINPFLPHFNAYLPCFCIDTPLRLAHFFAQVLHESGGLRYTEEIASGAAYDTGAKARMLGNTPARDGDGEKYKGRGLIQITGRYNYNMLNRWLNKPELDVYHYPRLLKRPDLAVLSAIHFWRVRNLNTLADEDNFMAVTRAVNGGIRGLTDRHELLERAKDVFGTFHK